MSAQLETMIPLGMAWIKLAQRAARELGYELKAG